MAHHSQRRLAATLEDHVVCVGVPWVLGGSAKRRTGPEFAPVGPRVYHSAAPPRRIALWHRHASLAQAPRAPG
eukprot:3364628-Pyramimonas_sp.AAC.1